MIRSPWSVVRGPWSASVRWPARIFEKYDPPAARHVPARGYARPMKTMRAIAKLRAGPGLDLVEVPVPTPGINDVLIKVKKTSICGTDVHIYNWDAWAEKTIKPPMIIGHEFVGVVEAVGSNVHSCKPGDLVDGEGHIVCGVCRNCLASAPLCKDTKGVRNRDARLRSTAFRRATPSPSAPSRSTCSCFDPLGNAVHTAAIRPHRRDVINGAAPSAAWPPPSRSRSVPATSSSPISTRSASRWRNAW